MTVKTLIKKLQKMPSNYQVLFYYDSAPRGEITSVVKMKNLSPDEDDPERFVVLGKRDEIEWNKQENLKFMR